MYHYSTRCAVRQLFFMARGVDPCKEALHPRRRGGDATPRRGYAEALWLRVMGGNGLDRVGFCRGLETASRALTLVVVFFFPDRLKRAFDVFPVLDHFSQMASESVCDVTRCLVVRVLPNLRLEAIDGCLCECFTD